MNLENQLYTIGGTVQAGSGRYIARQADKELLALCQASQFAYILTARQMGKSSLMMRTAEQLAQAGICSVQIDLTLIGTQVDAEGWYFGLLFEIRKQLRLTLNLVAWWREHAGLGPTQRFSFFCEEVLLQAIAEPLVIFIDEIDTTLSLDFTDDFYAAIRALYLGRAQRPELARLSFVLIGVATPGDLVRDPQRTPFNIGQRVEMTDFTLAEALPLADGFRLSTIEAQQVLQWVLEWTGGHPYLTQRLCQAIWETSPSTLSHNKKHVSGEGKAAWTATAIAALVHIIFLNGGRDQDNNLQFVRDMLTKRAPDRIAVLTTYRAVLRQQPPVPDEEQSLVKAHLKLSGIAHREEGYLRLRNRVYRTVFNERWIREHLPINWARRLQRAWRLVAGLSVVSLTLAVLTVFALTQQQEAQRQRQVALNEAATAVAAQGTAVAAQTTSEANRQQAEQQSQLARSRELAANAVAQLPTDPELALLLARAAEDAGHTEQSEAALRQILMAMPLRALLRGHTGAVVNANFSPDGQRLVTASADGTAIVWDIGNNSFYTDTGRANVRPDRIGILTPSAILRGHTGTVVRALFSPDNQLVVTADTNGAVRIWDMTKPLTQTTTLTPVAVLQAHPGGVTDVAFSPDGQRLVTVGNDKIARVWAVQDFVAHTGAVKALAVLRGHTGAILSAMFSADGTHLVTASDDATARVWDISSAITRTVTIDRSFILTPTLILDGHISTVRSARFSPDGTLIVTASQDGTARLWDATTGKELMTLLHNNRVTLALFSRDGMRVLTASLDGTARLWDVTQARQQATTADKPTPLSTLQAPTDGVNSAALSPDGAWIVTVGADGMTRIWHSNGQQSAMIHSDHCDVTGVNFSPDGATFVTFDRDGTARIWNTISQPSEIVFQGHHDLVNRAAFSPNRALVATASNDKLAGLWDAHTGNLLAMLTHDCPCPVRDIVFSPDGTKLLAGYDNNEAAVLDVQSHQKLLSLTGHAGLVQAVNFSADNRWIVTGSDDHTARVWDATSGQTMAVLKGHTGAVNMVSFSPDGKTILTASTDKTASVWPWDPPHRNMIVPDHTNVITTTITLTPFLTLTGPTEKVNSARFSPDGLLIITGGLHEPARIWAARTGAQLLTLPASQEQAYSVVFGPDGQSVLTAGADGIVRVWNATTGTLEVAFTAHTRSITSLEFSLDGRQLLTASADQTAHIYPWEQLAPLADLLRQANEQSTRTLTCTEQQRYLHVVNCVTL